MGEKGTSSVYLNPRELARRPPITGPIAILKFRTVLKLVAVLYNVVHNG